MRPHQLRAVISLCRQQGSRVLPIWLAAAVGVEGPSDADLAALALVRDYWIQHRPGVPMGPVLAQRYQPSQEAGLMAVLNARPLDVRDRQARGLLQWARGAGCQISVASVAGLVLTEPRTEAGDRLRQRWTGAWMRQWRSDADR